MIVDASVVARINACDAAFTGYNSRRTFRLEDGRFERREFGRAIAVRDSTRDDSYYNRIIGLGAGDLDDLDAMVAFHRDVNRACTVTLTPDRATPAVLVALAERGFVLQGTDTVFTRRCTSGALPAAAKHISRATPAELDRVIDLWTSADDPVPAEVRAKRAAAQFAAEFPIYVVRIDEQVVSMAAMFISDGIAWLGNAGTAPAYRGRGCQLALLAHRIAEAARLGCDWAVSDAEFGSISHRNILRAGLALAYMPVTLVRALGEP